jgi:YVTN family beta-propeller protein
VSQIAGDLEYVDVSPDVVVANVPTGTTPRWIGLSSDGTRAYVTNEGSNSVSVVDVARRTVIADIAADIGVGNVPRNIAVQAASKSP